MKWQFNETASWTNFFVLPVVLSVPATCLTPWRVVSSENLDQLGVFFSWLVFRKKDLYLIITQKLTFMKSGGFQVKSTQNLIKSDVSTKTLQFGGMHGGGYDPRFHEIQGHSPSPACIKLNSFCWNIWFYKVLGGFQVKSKRPLARNCNPMFETLVHCHAKDDA